MRVVRDAYFWQFGSITSLPTETTDGEILVAFLAKHGLRSDLRVPNLKFFSWGSMPPRLPYLLPTYAHTMAVPV